jgi:hypothetical protein
MKNFAASRRFLLSIITLGLELSFFGVALAAPPTGMQKQAGTGRPDNGQVLRVTVKFAGKLQPGVDVKVSAGDNSVAATGKTGKTGTYITTLGAGTYTVTATSTKGTASSPVTIVQSTDPALITLTLAPPAK